MSTNKELFQSSTQGTKLNKVSEQVGFDVPVEYAKLPSKGVLYGVDHPLANEVEVEFKAMTAKEEDILTNQALLRKGTVLNELLKSCILNKTIQPGTLLLGDRNALMIAIRITGYGADYEAEVTCPGCSEKTTSNFNLSNLAIKPLSGTPVAPNQNLFSFELPLCKKTVQFKLLTGDDDATMDAEEAQAKKLGTSSDAFVTRMLFHSIVSFDGVTDRDKLRQIVNNLRAGDSKALRTHMMKIRPDVDMSQSFSCDKCGDTSEVNIPLGASFFWPDFSK
jgi:hypothetical protein